MNSGLFDRNRASLIAQLVKNRLQCRRPWFDSWIEKIRWRRDRLPISVFLGFPCGSASKESAWSGSPFPSLEDLPNPGIKPKSPGLQVDSLLSEPQGKSKNTEMGSLSLLQGNLPNPGIEPGSPALQADSLPAELSGKPSHT